MIKVAPLQRGNKLIEYLGTASWHYDSSCSADYEINFSTLVLFLSLKFHSAKPEYIHKRISKLKDARLQVLLVLLDTPNYNTTLRELFRTIPITIIPCRTFEECSRYIKGFDLCARRGVDVLRKKDSGVDTFLRSFSKINKTDSTVLQGSSHSLNELFKMNERDLENLTGMGKIKASHFKSLLQKPFRKSG